MVTTFPKYFLASAVLMAQVGIAAPQTLEQAADDPTASLASVQVINIYNDLYHRDDSANQVLLRAAVPFSTGTLKHIARVSTPVITRSPFVDSGVSDTTLFDLVVFDRDWGRWGVGAVALLPTGGEDSGAEKWGLGPAIGFTAHKEKLLWGVFNQNVLTVGGEDDRDDVNISIFQPIINLGLGNGWSVGASEMGITYDWDASDWVSLPLGAKLAKLHKYGGVPIQIFGQYEYNFADDGFGPKNLYRVGLKVLFPVKG